MKKIYFLRRCECKHKQFDLKEAVAETQQIVNETQQMVKALYEAHKCEDGKMHCRNDNQCGANGKCINT